ncbi:MAG: hypothetical protein EVA76_02390 [Candidatus Pelagibacterales bacterium]|nr:MAG: hypothetical protein EVA76_02390 [Pelagibacterales bacterium]
MGKFLLRIFILLLVTIFFFTIYISYFGIETSRFDTLIKEKANQENKNIKLEFNKTKIYLNPSELNLVVKLKTPKILIIGNEINLTKINLFLPLKSFITSDFLLQRVEIAFFKNDIKDLVKISNIFLPKFFNKKLNKIFSKGNLEGEFIIRFNPDGSIAKNYQVNAKLLNADLNITKEIKIKNLYTDIKYILKSDKDKSINFIINKGKILNLDLQKSSIDINLVNNKKIIKSKIKTTGISKHSDIDVISSLFGLKLSNIKDIELVSDLETSVELYLDDKFKITDSLFSINGKINDFNLEHQEIKNIKGFVPYYKSKFFLKNVEVNFNQDSDLKLFGFVKINNEFEDFSLSGRVGKNFDLSGKFSLNDLSLKISSLNYFKGKNDEAYLDFNIKKDKLGYNINRLLYSSGKSKVELDKIKLNKELEVKDLRSIKIITFKNNIKNNDFHVGKHKKLKNTIFIKGELFDAEPILKSLYKTGSKKMLSRSFNTEIIINLDKAITGTNDDILNFSMIASIKNGSYNKLSLKGNFSQNEIIEMSIYQVNENKKTLQIISDRARPFVKSFDFIKGFEGGKLEYESTIFKKSSISNLAITDFKVSKVPALAQLLTLASLQGIADTLNGEGIRFESFEMKSNSEGNVLNIEDALAMGPAVSILLDGYVDKGKIVSLRGTLVPATKLNSIIASIPVVGEILVGKKTGEGVIGVSFKMKGPPKNIKTTVNPIKTLTPRFIVRAVEKMKKEKKEESK